VSVIEHKEDNGSYVENKRKLVCEEVSEKILKNIDFSTMLITHLS
jgi:hypothetical protein